MSEIINFLEIHNTEPPLYIADGKVVDSSFTKGKLVKIVKVEEYCDNILT